MLNPKENIDFVNDMFEDAKKGARSNIFLEKMGGLAIVAGIVDFLAIQAARALEQVIIKADIAQGCENFRITDPGAPHEDYWFYDHRISTRRILKETKKYIMIANCEPDIKKHVEDMCEHGENFLNDRITAIHYVGNPRISKEKMEEAVNRAFDSFGIFQDAFALFRSKIHNYTFSDVERKKFYGDDESKGLIITTSDYPL